MIKVSLDEMLSHVDNQYRLLRVAALRTKQLNRGAKPRVGDTTDHGLTQKTTTIALREIAGGTVEYSIGEPPPETGTDAA